MNEASSVSCPSPGKRTEVEGWCRIIANKVQAHKYIKVLLQLKIQLQPFYIN